MANSRDTYHRWRFTAKRGGYTHFVKDLGQTNIFSAHSPHRLSEKNCFCISAKPCFVFYPHVVESIAKELNSFYKWKKKTCVTTVYYCINPGPGDLLYKHSGYFGVQCACLCDCGIKSQTGPSVVQLGWLNEISDSNINSSASLMRTMGGNCFSKEGHYGSLCRDRTALFTKVIGHTGFETVHHTSHFALLC